MKEMKEMKEIKEMRGKKGNVNEEKREIMEKYLTRWKSWGFQFLCF